MRSEVRREEKLTRAVSDRRPARQTARAAGRRLLQVADAERDLDAQGRRVVPNTYIVQLSPADREGFADIEPAMLYELTEALRQHVKTEGYHVSGKARVALRTNTDLRKGRFDITAKNVDQEGNSQEVPVTPPEADAAPIAPVIPIHGDAPPAVLTVPGGQRVELHEGHYVVGRHLECDVRCGHRCRGLLRFPGDATTPEY